MNQTGWLMSNFSGNLKKMTKIEITNENGTYSIAIPHENVTISMMMENLIVPALLAAGYSDELITDAFSDNGHTM